MATKKGKKTKKLARGKKLEEQTPLTVTRADFNIVKPADVPTPKF